MFKYNTLSDLKDGTCVTPIRKEDSFIICKSENDEEVKKFLTDFDFAKKPEERGFVLTEETVVKMEEDLREEVVKEEDIKEETLTASEPIEVLEVARVVTEEIILEVVPILRKNPKVSIERQVIRGYK